MAEILVEELNLKAVKFENTVNSSDITDSTEATATGYSSYAILLDLVMTPELKQEGLMREIIRNVQQARKAAGLEVDDRIKLGLTSDDADIQAVLASNELLLTIAQETLASEAIMLPVEGGHTVVVKVEGAELAISFTVVAVSDKIDFI